MKHSISVIAALALALCVLPQVASAGVPEMIHYQGHLTDSGGSPLDTVISMTFTIYDDSVSGTVWWTQTKSGVVVDNGLFNVLLGSPNAIVDTVFTGPNRWLGIQIGSDPEISPRTRLVTVPYAYRVATVDGAGGGDVFGNIHLHSALVVGNLDQSSPGLLEVTDGSETFMVADGSTRRMGIGMVDPNAQFHVETTDYLFSGSFTGFYPSNSAKVVKAEYLGEAAYDAVAVYGRSAPQDCYGFGGYFQGGRMGVVGEVSPEGDGFYVGVRGGVQGGSGTNDGLYGSAGGSGVNYGAVGEAQDSGATVNYGVYGWADGSEQRYAVYGDAGGDTYPFAGYFRGNVEITGTLAKGGGGFKIDHPLDPANKYLYHSFVESPDMKNVYDGVVTLDGRGEAGVELPKYFDALNEDFRYQLTAIGAPGPDLYIAEKISNNRFRIAGGRPGMEVSWQVTGIRKDRFAQANRIQVEIDKPAKERGTYLHPGAQGLGQEFGVHYQQQRKMRESLAKAKEKGLKK